MRDPCDGLGLIRGIISDSRYHCGPMRAEHRELAYDKAMLSGTFCRGVEMERAGI